MVVEVGIRQHAERVRRDVAEHREYHDLGVRRGRDQRHERRHEGHAFAIRSADSRPDVCRELRLRG